MRQKHDNELTCIWAADAGGRIVVEGAHYTWQAEEPYCQSNRPEGRTKAMAGKGESSRIVQNLALTGSIRSLRPSLLQTLRSKSNLLRHRRTARYARLSLRLYQLLHEQEINQSSQKGKVSDTIYENTDQGGAWRCHN